MPSRFPPSELTADVDPDTCDTSDFTPVAPRDGSFSVVLKLDIGEDVRHASTAAQPSIQLNWQAATA
jgi:hypothetical protein